MTDHGPFLTDSLNTLRALLEPTGPVVAQLGAVKEAFVEASHAGNKVMLFGNGGSAAIAAHVAIDLTKNAGIHAMQCNEYGWITCLANDFGYEHWMEKSVEFHGRPGDVAVFVSSSGASPNVLRGARCARDLGLKVVTFSGFEPGNPLSRLGDINLYCPSRAYNHVEMTHQSWLLCVVDAIIGTSVYPARPEPVV